MPCMTYSSHLSNKKEEGLIPAHGGYRKLKSYQSSEIVFDLTKIFCQKWVSKFDRTFDQMIQAARSGKQNIAEGSMASGTSKKTEIKLVNVARASLEELLLDYEDFLRNNNLKKWEKDHSLAREVRAKAYLSDRSYRTYLTYLKSAENFANTLICLIHQTNFLLDRQLQSLGKSFLTEGGFTERLYWARMSYRTDKSYKTNKNL